MASLQETIPTGDAIKYLNTVTDVLPTRVAEPIQAAGDQILNLLNPQSPMTASPPAPLAVVDPSSVAAEQVTIVETPKAATNTKVLGVVVVAGLLGWLFLRK